MKRPKIGKDQIVDTYYPVLKDLDDEKTFQEYEDEILKTNNVFISTFAMYFQHDFSKKRRKEIDELWKKKLQT